MKTGPNIALTLVSVCALAAAVLAWHEHGELAALRLQLADGDLAMLKNQVAMDKKTIASLQDRLAAMRGRRGANGELANELGDGPGQDGPGAGAGRRGGRFGPWADMAANPEFQKLLSIQMRGRINQTYGALFKQLNLTPDQLAQFQGMLADKQQALMDVMQAAREQGINPREDPDGFKTLVNQALTQTDAQIEQALGPADYAQYQQYQQTLPERNVVSTLQQQLGYSQTPLSDDQASAMISLLAQNQPVRSGGGTAGTGNGGEGGPGPMALMNGGGNAKVTDATLAQASGILSAPQVAALQQIQEQQQAQQQMQQMMRAAYQGSSGAGAAPAAPAASGGGKG
jgi:hypothetical protein